MRKHGLRIKLPEQPFHALTVLVDRQGQVVTREELRKALWPDQSWGDLDHRLNKTINRIREALGDSAESPRFIETLPRIGYRFLLPVQALPSEATARARGERPAGSRRLLWPLVAASVLTIVLALTLPSAFRTFGRTGSLILPGYEPTPLTTYLGSELYPCFSPDGSQVVFAWDGEAQKTFHIFVTGVNPGAPRQLTNGQDSDYGPVWSPDGRSIAFLRESKAGQTAEVRVVRPDGSGERKIAELVPARTDHPLSWTRDSRWLVMAANPPGDGAPALFLISAETGEQRRLTSPPVHSGGDLSPAISPDGAMLAFTRSTSAAWRDVFVLPLSRDLAPTQEPIRITNVRRVVDTLAWSADGRSLFFSAGATQAGSRFLFRVNPSTSSLNGGLVETGIEGSDPAISPAGGELAYVRQNIEQTSILRVQVARGPSGGPDRWSRLMSSTRRDFTADISPDGKRLVFSSARSGTTEIWVSNLDGSDLKRLASLGATPRWSPDGRRIAFESTADGQSEIYAIDVETGASVRLTNAPGSDIYPSWSRDGKFIYFSSDRSGKPQIWRVPSTGGDAVQITRLGGTYAVERFDGKTIYYTTPDRPAAIRSAPANGGAETGVIQGVVGLAAIAMAPDGLYYLASLTSSSATLDLYDFATHTSRLIAQIDHPVHHVLSSPPDGRSVLFTQIDRQDSDVMLVRVK